MTATMPMETQVSCRRTGEDFSPCLIVATWSARLLASTETAAFRGAGFLSVRFCMKDIPDFRQRHEPCQACIPLFEHPQIG
jgi:hypothetical protein